MDLRALPRVGRLFEQRRTHHGAMPMNDLLIQNARVWPAADADPIEDGRVLIRDGRILRVGRFSARAETVIDADGCWVLPGLIQSHVHLCQTLFRGAAEDMELLPWLHERIWPLEAAHDPDSIHASARLACAEMIRGGVTAFLSIETVRHTAVAFEAVAETGLMGVISHCLMDESGGYEALAEDVEDALAYCDVILGRLEGNDRLRLAVAPRFALSSSESSLREATAYARDRGLRLHTHASEQVPEVLAVRKQTGRNNIEYLHDVGLTGPDVCLAHCVHVSELEREILRETGTHVLHCPTANLKLGSGVAPIPEYLRMGINVGLGSDGAPCNNRLDLFQEMRTAGLVQKPLHGPVALPAQAIVGMATEGGARALGWETEMGRLEPGKLANLILIDPNRLHALPSEDPAASVVYAHGADDVEMTIVNGRILFEEGHLTTIDEEQLVDEVRRQRRKLFQRAGLA